MANVRTYVVPHRFGEMVGALKTILSEYASTDGSRQPFLLASHIYNAANSMASSTWCMYRQRIGDITINEQNGLPNYWYTAPDILKPMVVTCTWSDGTLHYLGIVTPTEMDSIFGIAWRDPNQAQSGNPCYFVYEPLRSYQLYPRPEGYATECKSGITIEGYYVPGEQWNPSLPADDPGQDDAWCPLPISAHYAVVIGAAINRIREMNNPGALQHIALLQPQYNDIVQQLASQVLNSPAPLAYEGAAGAACGGGGYVWGGLGATM